VEVISKVNAQRSDVRSIAWLDLGRAIQFSDVPIFSVALNSDSETAESKKARNHQNTARYERHLSNGISATEEYSDETDYKTDDAANVSSRGPIWRWPQLRQDEGGSIVRLLAWWEVHVEVT
jgi:hypothetical protein